MKVLLHKKFLKDLAKLPESPRVEIEKLAFETLLQTNKFSEIVIFEKMKGYKNYYKARFGNYRLGVKFEDEILTFERVLHRKEIYRIFP